MPPGPKRRGKHNTKVENSLISSKLSNQPKKDTRDEVESEWPDLGNSNQSGDTKRRTNTKSERSCKVSEETDTQVIQRDAKAAPKEAGENEEEDKSYKGKYKKRAVLSNWDRYNETPEINDEEQGADFETLLSYSGGSGTQFRLSDEKDWEDGISEVDKSNYLSIDCNALASALLCIPLHKRLGLPEVTFTPEIVSRFQETAKLHHKQYRPLEKKIDLTDDKNSIVEKETDITTKMKPTQIVDKLELNKPSSLSKTTVVTENLIESLASCLSLKEMSELSNTDTTVNTNLAETVVKEQPVDMADDDLDFLLSLSSKPPAKLPETSSKTNTEIAAKKSIDEWLDSVLEDN